MPSEIDRHFEAELKNHQIHKAKVDAMDKIFAMHKSREELKATFNLKSTEFDILVKAIEQLREDIAKEEAEYGELTEKHTKSHIELKAWFNEHQSEGGKLLEILEGFKGSRELSIIAEPVKIEPKEASLNKCDIATSLSTSRNGGAKEENGSLQVMSEVTAGSLRFMRYLGASRELEAKSIQLTAAKARLAEIEPGFLILEQDLKEVQKKISQLDESYQVAKEQWSIEWTKLWRPEIIPNTEMKTLNPALADLQISEALNIEYISQLENEKERNEKLVPLVIAGYHVRRRKFEWQKGKTEQNEEILNLGRKAAHGRMVLADASMFMSSLPTNLTMLTHKKDAKIFINLYAFKPHTVLKNQACEKFIDILGWHASVKHHTGHLNSFEDTEFSSQWKRFSAF